MSAEGELPPPCTECGKPSVTKDGRHWCRGCLRRWIEQQSPIKRGRTRTPDEREDKRREPDPWQELNLRILEDGCNDA